MKLQTTIFICISFIVLASAQDNTFDFSFLEELTLQKRSTKNNYFSIGFAEPNVFTQSYGGGIYLLGKDEWYIYPADSNYVRTLAFNPKDKEELFLVESSSQGTFFRHFIDERNSKFQIPSGEYKLFIYGHKILIIGVLPSLRSICYSYDFKSKNFKSEFLYEEIITDIAFNGRQFFLSCLSNVLVFEPENEDISILFELDEIIYGIELTPEQELLISLESGLYIQSLVKDEEMIKFSTSDYGDISRIGSKYLLNSIENKVIVFEY